MKNQKIKSEIDEMIVEQLRVEYSDITPEARIIEDLGADSLDCVELLIALEEELNIVIPDEEAEKIRTVGDVYAYVSEKGF